FRFIGENPRLRAIGDDEPHGLAHAFPPSMRDSSQYHHSLSIWRCRSTLADGWSIRRAPLLGCSRDETGEVIMSGDIQRVYLVTGAGSGIGAAVCRRLAGPGIGLLVHTGSKREKAVAVAEECAAKGAACQIAVGDLAE